MQSLRVNNPTEYEKLKPKVDRFFELHEELYG
jgi:hypothetical protein